MHAGTLVGRRVRIVQGSPLVAPSFRFLSGEAGMAMGYEEATGELVISLDNPKFGQLNLHTLAARALAVPAAAGATAAGATTAAGIAAAQEALRAEAPPHEQPHALSCLTARSKCRPPWQQRPSSAPAPPQGVPGGSGQLGTPRERPAHWAPSHCLGCSSAPPHRKPLT